MELSLSVPAKLKAPISRTHPQKIKLTLQGARIENKQLKQEIQSLRLEIQQKSVTVDGDMEKDLKSIMSAADQSNMPPFMKMFWEEQQKYLQTSKNAVRYHPMIIRYCLSLAAKSPAAYEELRYNDKTGTGKTSENCFNIENDNLIIDCEILLFSNIYRESASKELSELVLEKKIKDEIFEVVPKDHLIKTYGSFLLNTVAGFKKLNSISQRMRVLA